MGEVRIPDPSWGSSLANVILDLEKLRTKRLGGAVPPWIFFQLKEIFQILETLGSARIEGNNTTLAEYVESIIDSPERQGEANLEIKNIEEAITFIEQNTNENTKFNRAYVSQLHQILTRNLTPPPNGEGSWHPGELRKGEVSIKSSSHIPPPPMALRDYFDKFLEFINHDHKEQYQLLMVAIAHHRFEYIHPFDNANGRMGRLLNYALLIKLGFQVKNGRILNPSSVFYTDREKYYEMLSLADSLQDADILRWCEYFLLGLKNEIEKIDSLLDIGYVREKILVPTLENALKREHITRLESRVLNHLVHKEDLSMKAQELSALGIRGSKEKSRIMGKLREKKIVMSIKPNGRIYTLRFVNNYLLRGVMDVLKENGFVSDFLNEARVKR
jgi:Fic family protein